MVCKGTDIVGRKLKQQMQQINTITFNKGTYLKPNTVAFKQYENIPGINSIPKDQQSLIPNVFVLPQKDSTNLSTDNIVTYLGEGSSHARTFGHYLWGPIVREEQEQNLTRPDFVLFEGAADEYTEFHWKGLQCGLAVNFYQRVYTTANPDKGFTSADHVLLRDPAPEIKAERVDYFKIGGKRKKVVSYKHDVVSGNCEIKYMNCCHKVK
jgi:hypothetical protein